MVRYGVITLVVYVGLVYLAYGMFKIVPTGFIPTQDQGYLIVERSDAGRVVDRSDRRSDDATGGHGA